MMVLEESVYNLIPPAQTIPYKPALYRSKHDGHIDPHAFEMGPRTAKPAATFGRPLGAHQPEATAFLRSHAKEPCLPEPTAPTMHIKQKSRPPVPKADERPVHGLTSGKNFITTNAVEVILAKPTKQRTASSQLVYTSKPDFGKVPTYLKRNKQRVADEKAQVEAYIRARQQEEVSQHVTQMTESERQDLLAHLKTKWSSVNTAYQKLSFELDTPAKQKRKESYERQLAEIEKDIQTLERGDIVLITED